VPPNREARSVGRADDVDLLAHLWQTWQTTGQALTPDQWASQSGLGTWTVRDLYAHVSRGVTTTAGLVASPSPPEIPDAAAYFRALRALGPQGATHVAEAARDWAATHPVETLIADFGALAATTLAKIRTTGTVTTIAGTMRMSDYALTRVLEATVHLLDLTTATPGIATIPEEALRRTVDVLTDLTPPADFIALATGRPAPPVFPVLT
jgi:uncharacterized protein (TIGR03083 family)